MSEIRIVYSHTNGNEGRLILSQIEQQVGSDTIAEWVIDGCAEYKRNKSLQLGCISSFIVNYVEGRYKDRKHPIVQEHIPEEREI